MNEDLVKRIAAVFGLLALVFTLWSALSRPMEQRIADLEAEVIKRRAGTASVSKKEWAAPELDIPALDASGDVPAPKKAKAKLG